MASKIQQNIAKYGNATSIKEELLVFTAAINPITVVTNTPTIPIIVILISLQPIKEELLEDKQDSVLIYL